MKDKGYRAAYCPNVASTDAAEIRAYAEAAKKADIVIAEVGAWSNPIHPNDEDCRTAIHYCIERLALAEEIGAACCVNIAGSRSPTVWSRMGCQSGGVNAMKERFPKKITRRTFLTTSVKLAIGWAGILAGSSGIFFLQADKQAKRTAQEVPGHLVKLGDYNQLSAIKGVQKVSYDATVRDAWVTNSVKGFVYVKSESNGHLLIMSPSCTHLGCNIEQVPEAEPGETKGVFFRCPCHGAEFDMRGNAVGKVVLRGLDTFEPIIAKDSVYIDILSPIKGRHVIEN